MPDDQNPAPVGVNQNPVTGFNPGADSQSVSAPKTPFIATNDDLPLVQNPPQPQQTGQQPPAPSVLEDIPPVVTPPPKRKIDKKVIGGVVAVLILVVGLGAGIILVQRQQEIREKAATFPVGGEYTNLCGTGVGGSQYSCSADCDTNTGVCKGNFVYKFTCDGRQDECRSNESGPTDSQSLAGTVCNKTVQIDVYDKSCRDESGNWVCKSEGSDSNLKGYIVWYSGACTGGEQLPPSKKACGETCQTSSDCISESSTGVPVVCRNNRCESVNCKSPGRSEGSRCDCVGAATIACGDLCGQDRGVNCEEGSRCTYVKGSSCRESDEKRCIGAFVAPNFEQTGNPDYSRPFCISGDKNNHLLLGPGNKQTGFTSQEILSTCRLCGNGIVQEGEECDDGTNNGSASSVCDTNCKVKNVLACTAISKDKPTPEIGDEISFACTAGAPAGKQITSYEFRYRIGSENFQTLEPESASSNKSKKLKVEKTGTYTAQCRACSGSECTDWNLL